MTELRPQSEGFSFYRVPRQLIKGREYRPLSPAGKLLFGLPLDRVSLSVRNGWQDGEVRAYVYYAVAEICEDFGCSRVTAGKLLAELERIGLIERKKQGQGKPDRNVFYRETSFPFIRQTEKQHTVLSKYSIC